MARFLKRNKSIIISVILFLVIMGSLAYAIIGKFSDKDVANNIPEGTNENQENNQPENEESANLTLQEEAIKLNQTYPDVKAWLRVPNTNINAPVFQTSNSEKYLTIDRTGNNTGWGEIFLDHRSDINNMDNMSHFIIYGHNSERDTYFSQLLKYKDYNFFKDNRIIEMSTLNGNYKWEIFSVFVTNTNFFYIDTNFANTTEYSDFLRLMKNSSRYDTGVQINGDETILTLSTCDYTIDDGRFAVQAKLVK